MSSSLKYTDEKDKSYGLTGMAISMIVLDGEEYLSGMSIDAPVGEGVELSQDFYFIGNPRLSAKIAWNEILKHFQLSAGMVISNVMCRNYVQHRRKLSSELVALLKDLVREEAKENCSLDEDESDMIFEKSLNYFDRIFSYARVHEIAHEFASAIVKQRSMSAQEIIEHLRQLSML
ncbi:MAG: hypothetical protein K2K00_09345 [Muribaculaceae bacterium]|nr:hypothetical protein [Muribaculaceae bacterium]